MEEFICPQFQLQTQSFWKTYIFPVTEMAKPQFGAPNLKQKLVEGDWCSNILYRCCSHTRIKELVKIIPCAENSHAVSESL